MLGFRGVKLPPFFGLQKFFGKYLFKTVIFDSVSTPLALNPTSKVHKKGWHPCKEMPAAKRF